MNFAREFRRGVTKAILYTDEVLTVKYYCDGDFSLHREKRSFGPRRYHADSSERRLVAYFDSEIEYVNNTI